MAANSETIVLPKNWRIRALVESGAFSAFVTAVIIVNAITLGLETSPLQGRDVAGREEVACR